MNKYEQLIEFIINDETDRARELFHEIVVEKSRDIYESLMDEEVGSNEVEDLVDEITAEEEGMVENEEEYNDAEMDMDMDTDVDDTDDEFDYDNDGETDEHEEDHGEIEDRVDDLESALDELQAEFDALMSDDAEESDYDEMDDADNIDSEMDSMDSEMDVDIDDDMVREYVEKVGETGQKTEGGEVAHGKSASVNKQSTVAGKNDIGGSAKNIAQGHSAKESASPEKPQEIKSGNRNVPGGKAGDAYNKKESAKTDAKSDAASVIKGRK